ETDDVFHAFGATISNLKSFGNIDGAGFSITHDWEWPFFGRTVSGQVTIQSGATMNAPNGGTFSNAFVNINGTANLASACLTNGSSFNVNFGGKATVNPPFGTIALGTCGSNASLRINPTGKLLVNVTGR